MIDSPVSRPSDLMRRLNELAWEGHNVDGGTEPVAFFCECTDPSCYRPVWLTPAEYELARGNPEWVAKAPDHETAAGLVRIA